MSVKNINSLLFRKNFVVWFIFIFLILIVALRRIVPTLPSEFQLTRIVYSFLEKESIFLFKDNFYLKFLKLALQSLIIIFPIIGITIIEFFKSDQSFRNRFSETSLGKISNSEGKNASEIWFFFLSLFMRRLPLVVTLISFGLSNLAVTLEKPISSIFSNFIPNNISHSISIIYMLAAVLLTDFHRYYTHYLSHKIPFLWNLHEFHHASSEMVILNQSRELPLQQAINYIFSLPVVGISTILFSTCISNGFTIPIYLYILYTLIDLTQAFVGHSSLKLIYPKPISFFLMSPSLHWIHHSKNQNHYDKNMGFVFPFWDKIFGTYLDESHLKDITGFGVEGTKYNNFHPLYSYFVLPILKIRKSINLFST